MSGSHASGKTTLIEAFLSRHARFAYEPEPYAVLQELYGEQFAEQPDVEDFERQLALHTEMLARYGPRDDVIFERCPADFLAYMLVVAEQSSQRSSHDRDKWVATVSEALALLDLIVFLPLDRLTPIDVAEGEDLQLRAAVDDRLQDILLNDEFDLFSSAIPAVIEARGSVEQRVQIVERGIGSTD